MLKLNQGDIRGVSCSCVGLWSTEGSGGLWRGEGTPCWSKGTSASGSRRVWGSPPGAFGSVGLGGYGCQALCEQWGPIQPGEWKHHLSPALGVSVACAPRESCREALESTFPGLQDRADWGHLWVRLFPLDQEAAARGRGVRGQHPCLEAHCLFKVPEALLSLARPSPAVGTSGKRSVAL